MPEFTFTSHSETDNLSIAQEILEMCEREKIFAFYGHLGAGKTTLIKSFCHVLGVNNTVSSPTFNLIHEYRTQRLIIYHFDFYRIKSEIEAYDIGGDEYLDSGNFCFIEWPEKIPTLLPKERVNIYINQIENQKRVIRITY